MLGFMNQADDQVTYFGLTQNRRRDARFGIKQRDRLAHMYIIGKTGTGKSTLLEIMARQDIEAGRGIALLDPHGDLVERLVASVPAERRQDLVYFNVPDSQQALGFNPLDSVAPEKRAVTASGLLEVFKKIWSDYWGPRMEHILRNTLLALLDQPEATLPDILRLFHDRAFRTQAITRISNPQVRQFWEQEYASYPPRMRAEAVSPIQNKVGAFLANPIMHQIVGHPRSSFDLRQVMDEGKILLVNLSKGKIGEDSSALLGALLVAHVGLAALGRTDAPADQRRPFFLYLDEFYIFSTLQLATMLSELRKYGLGMILAHQYLSQLEKEVRDAILGNVATIISFRLGLPDAELIGKEFHPAFSAVDLVGLPNYHVYLKLMVDGVVSKPFGAILEWPDS